MKVQKEYLKVRRELNATSSQDEFAKWAKLRRQHDKLLEQLEKMSAYHTQACCRHHGTEADSYRLLESSQEATKSRFDSTLSIVRWTATRGVKMILPFWYSKQPMFWLPQGWFPYYVEWILSFPRAPIGSISIVSWQLACAGVIMLVSDTITAILGLILSGKIRAREEPLKPQAGGEKAKAADTKAA
jgi:tail-anchored protein insertion receptor